MEKSSLNEAAKLSLGKVRQIRNTIQEKAGDLKRILVDPQRNKNVNLITRLEDIENLLKELRLACMEVIFYAFNFAREKKIEGTLWEAHVIVNAEYRRVVDHVNTQNQVVLKRKVDKLYRDFLKTSQSFYTGYIQRLASQFHIPELLQVAHGLNVDVLVTPQQNRELSASLRMELIDSCYQTLVRMGDLARYRCQNTEKPPKSSLDIALAHYGLARMLDPDDGASYHQTAVLYKPSANNLEIVYYFLRSISVAKPHRLGARNLETARKSILNNQTGPRGNPKHSVGKLPSEALTTWFLKLHAYYLQGCAFTARDELEKEVLHRMEVCFKSEGTENLALRMTLLSMAACDFAFDNIKDTKDWTVERSQSCQYLLLFQVRVAASLLRTFKSIVQNDATTNVTLNPSNGSVTTLDEAGFSASFTRLIPLIRIYLAWIYVSREDLNRYQEWLEPFIRDLYVLLANVLTLLLPYANGNSGIIDSKYLLSEDTEALGLKVFSDRKLPLFLDVQILPGYNPPKCRKTRKDRKEIIGIDYGSKAETVWRIRDILCCGVYLAGSAKSPLTITTTADNIDVWVYLKDEPLKSIDEVNVTRMLAQVKMTAHKVGATADGQLDLTSPDSRSPIGPSLPEQTNLISAPGHHGKQDSYAEPQENVYIGPSAASVAPQLYLDDEMSADPNMAGMVDKLLDEDEDDVPVQSNKTHGETSYGMNSSAAKEVFGNLIPSPVANAPGLTIDPDTSRSKAIPNLPWNYFWQEAGANNLAEGGKDVPRSLSDQLGGGPIEHGLNYASYTGAQKPIEGHFSMYGNQYGSSVAQIPSAAVAAPTSPVRADPNSVTYSTDQQTAALDKLKAQLFAQYGGGAGSSSQSPAYAYGKSANQSQNGALLSGQSHGHRSRTSFPSPLVNLHSLPASPGQTKDALSPSLLDVQLGRSQPGVTAQSPIGRAIDMKNEAQRQSSSPSSSGYGFARPGSQGLANTGLARSPGIGSTTFAQQLTALPATGSSPAFSNASSLWAGTPAARVAPEAPRGTVACNGNFFNATTPFGRSGFVNNRDDPTHFRNRLQELGAGAGESIAAYDRAILESALGDDKARRRQN
ncbi:hypothetical protein BKA67DRAFT_275089 [Truncatella angustata]|uniref:Nonsense-mediated mRNA decay factor n=1 Tax=Truncatella angustata TaxID=152316 RepID=A0A9P8ULJ1_9PEZI|nr:uncharacterized protein BKA67DRAFT_275089 [Truncatella angustata]KAH6654323.1 hypothetical protein BKA67DRAFT_275089 [Truncatella angustata]